MTGHDNIALLRELRTGWVFDVTVETFCMESAGTFPRLFTVNQTNALLPTVRPLIEGILENIRRLKNKSETVISHEQLDPAATDLMDRLQQNDEILQLVEIKNGVEEIHNHGCICKGVNKASSTSLRPWRRRCFMVAAG